MTKVQRVLAGVLLALPLTAFGVLFAQEVRERVDQMKSLPAHTRTVTSGSADANAATTPSDPQATSGNPKGACAFSFSSAGATATVWVNLYHASDGGWHGTAFIGTVTASTIRTADGTRYSCDEIISWSTRGARYSDVKVLNVSAGNVRPIPWHYGVDTRPGSED